MHFCANIFFHVHHLPTDPALSDITVTPMSTLSRSAPLSKVINVRTVARSLVTAMQQLIIFTAAFVVAIAVLMLRTVPPRSLNQMTSHATSALPLSSHSMSTTGMSVFMRALSSWSLPSASPFHTMFSNKLDDLIRDQPGWQQRRLASVMSKESYLTLTNEEILEIMRYLVTNNESLVSRLVAVRGFLLQCTQLRSGNQFVVAVGAAMVRWSRANQAMFALRVTKKEMHTQIGFSLLWAFDALVQSFKARLGSMLVCPKPKIVWDFEEKVQPVPIGLKIAVIDFVRQLNTYAVKFKSLSINVFNPNQLLPFHMDILSLPGSGVRRGFPGPGLFKMKMIEYLERHKALVWA